MIIDTKLNDDIFRLEREYEQAKAETDAVIAMLRKQIGAQPCHR